MSHGDWGWQTRCAHRSASTAVLPEPAAAETSRLTPVVSMPARCCDVHFTAFSRATGTPLARLEDAQQNVFAIHRMQDAVPVGRLESADGPVLALRAGADLAE